MIENSKITSSSLVNSKEIQSNNSIEKNDDNESVSIFLKGSDNLDDINANNHYLAEMKGESIKDILIKNGLITEDQPDDDKFKAFLKKKVLKDFLKDILRNKEYPIEDEQDDADTIEALFKEGYSNDMQDFAYEFEEKFRLTFIKMFTDELNNLPSNKWISTDLLKKAQQGELTIEMIEYVMNALKNPADEKLFPLKEL